MKKAYNQYGKLVDIIESKASDTYTCPICKEILLRKFGVQNQFYSHVINKGKECELKYKLLEKEAEVQRSENAISILNEYYTKKFDNVKIELSDYMSDEGYYLTQEQKDIIISTEDRIKVAALAGCVDGDTEFFNGTQWKRIADYRENDNVLQFNNNWEGEIVKPTNFIQLPCNKMTRYKTKYGIDMVLSDEHNVVYIATSHNKKNYWKNVSLLKIKEKDMRERHIKNKTGFCGKFLTTFDYNGNYFTGLSEYELRLTIAIMADGHYGREESNWCRINIKKEHKKERVKYLLNKCNIEYKESQWNPKDTQYINICFYSPLHIKHFPKEWYNLNKKEKEIIVDEIKYWDGNEGLGNRGIVYRTSSKSDADFIQFMMTSLGKRSTIDEYKVNGQDYILSINNKTYTRKSDLYVVHEINRNNIVSMGQQSKELNKNNVISEYKTLDGFKYCFTVPSGMLVLRRNNKIFITGNSSKSTTLYYYAKERPFSNILYIVYNKSMKEEAEKTFGKLSHVEIKTMHGLAYSYVGKFYRNKLVNSYGVVDIIKDLNLDWNRDMELAAKVNAMMKEYMLSEKEKFEDIEFFKDDEPVRNLVINKCNQLWELKKNYKNDVKVEHDFYLKMFALSKKDLSDKYDILLLDECLPASQYVKTNNGIMKIKKLYEMYKNKETTPLILSYNTDKDIFEYKPMVWANKSENRQLLEITTEGLNKLQCTENHKILTQRGYIRADELIIGKDSLVLDNIHNQKTKYKLNDDQKQILLGSFLGDGHLCKQSNFNTFRLRFTQGEKQLDYLKSKISAFNLNIKKIKSGYTGRLSVYNSDYTKVFLLENDIWDEIKDINELGLAIWYQDDGSYSLSSSTISVNSNQLSFEETKCLRDLIYEKYDINFIVSQTKKYYYLRANKEDSNKFLKLIAPFMHPSMQYKTNIDISNNYIKYNNCYLNHGGNYIKEVKKIRCEDVYDIEVVDNHNFVTTRSYDKATSGIVVHNCQDSNMMILDMIYNSKVNGVVICGDSFQQLYGFRRAINILPYFEGKEYYLTTSFRVSQNTANIANMIIKDMSNKEINMKGFNTKQTIIDSIDKSKQYACLCRTNAYIFSEVFDVISGDLHKKVYFEGGFSSYNFISIKNAYSFSIGYKVHDPLFSKFKNYSQMIEYAKQVEDLELLALDKMVCKYGDRIPKIIDSIKNNTINKRNEADVVFTTIHRSKGLTLSMPVYIANDHFDIEGAFKRLYIEKDQEYKLEKDYEEMCILYVAITRAAGQLQLSDKLKSYLLLRDSYFKCK